MTRRNSRINLESVEICSKLYSRILKEIYEGDLCINRSSVSSVTTSDSIINKLVNTLKHRQIALARPTWLSHAFTGTKHTVLYPGRDHVNTHNSPLTRFGARSLVCWEPARYKSMLCKLTLLRHQAFTHQAWRDLGNPGITLLHPRAVHNSLTDHH